MCSPASPHAIGAAKSWVRRLTDGTVYVEIDAVRPVGPVLEPVAARCDRERDRSGGGVCSLIWGHGSESRRGRYLYVRAQNLRMM
jgi:hypothetical protein